MRKYLRWSPVLFIISTIGFGFLEIITGNFNRGLLPVPLQVPGRILLAYCSGAIFILLGIGLFIKKWRATASYCLGIVWLAFFCLLHLVLLSGDVFNGGEWTAAFEVLILCSGAFLVTTIYSSPLNDPANFKTKTGKLLTFSRYALALALVVFAILHFKYAEYISTLIPAWIPVPLFLAYFIGVGFMMTAISIAMNKLASLSTGITGCMFLLWVFILHGPRTVVAVDSEPEWTSLFVAMACSGTFLMLSYLSIRKR